MNNPVGTVSQLWRYPVKSMLGEQLGSLEIDRRGAVADRSWAVTDSDGKIGSGKNTRRFRRVDGLLACSARLDGDVPVVTLPDGRQVRAGDAEADQALRRALRHADLTMTRESSVAHHDAAPLHVITEASIQQVGEQVRDAAVDARRFRPNLVVSTGGGAGFEEDAWIGRTARFGEVVVEFTEGTERCVMVNAAQQDLPRSHQLLKHLAQAHDLDLGVYATVVRPGVVRQGDPVTLL